jgi:hypothetical protein
MLPLVYRNIGTIEDVGHWLRPFAEKTQLHNQQQILLLHDVLAQLTTANVPILLLADAPLALAYYPTPDTRRIDVPALLIPANRVDEALRSLQTLGFAPDTTAPRHADVRPSLCLTHPEQGSLRLRWHVLHQYPYTEVDAGFWANAQPLRLSTDLIAQTLSPTHLLFHTLVEGYTAWQSAAVHWIPDCLMLIRRGLIAWHDLFDLAEQYCLRVPVRQGLKQLQAHFGLVLPEAARHRLRCLTPTLAEQRYFELLGSPPTSPFWKEVYYFQRSQLAFQLFQPRTSRPSLPRFLWEHLTMRLRLPNAEMGL